MDNSRAFLYKNPSTSTDGTRKRRSQLDPVMRLEDDEYGQENVSFCYYIPLEISYENVLIYETINSYIK